MLDLADLATHHPQVALLHFAGPAVVARLGSDPTPVLSGTMQRPLDVTHLPRSGGGPTEVTRVVGWASATPDILEASRLVPFTLNEGDVTELAAIGVMALLAHDLEAGEVRTVLPIGTGADYLIEVGTAGGHRVEVSGVHTDPDRSRTAARLGEKRRQLLGVNSEGFVSVTTFSHGPERTAHSHLRFVRRSSDATSAGEVQS